MVKRVSKGTSAGGQFAPDNSGQHPPTSATNIIRKEQEKSLADTKKLTVQNAYNLYVEKMAQTQHEKKAYAVIGLPVVLTLTDDNKLYVDVDMGEAGEGVDDAVYEDYGVEGDTDALVERLQAYQIVEHSPSSVKAQATVGLPVELTLYDDDKISVAVDMAEAARSVDDNAFDDYGVYGDTNALIEFLENRDSEPIYMLPADFDE